MNIENIFEENKKQLKDEFVCDGTFKVIVDESVAIETPCFLIKSGTIIPQDWEIFEEAIFGFDGANAKSVFENKDGKFPCLFDEQDSNMKTIVPGVILPEYIENRVNEVLIKFADNPEILKEIGVDKEAWDSYMNAKGNNKAKMKV